jgi:hypothetical protein
MISQNKFGVPLIYNKRINNIPEINKMNYPKHVTFDTRPNVRYLPSNPAHSSHHSSSSSPPHPSHSSHPSYPAYSSASQGFMHSSSQYGGLAGSQYNRSEFRGGLGGSFFDEIKRKIYENKYVLIGGVVSSLIGVLIAKYFMKDEFWSKRTFVTFFSAVLAFIVTEVALKRMGKM